MIFAAAGRTAFDANSVPAVMQRILHDEPDMSGLPPSLLPVVRQCLDKDPGRRPSARDLLLRLVDPSAQRPPASDTGPVPVTAGPTVPGHEPTQLSRPGTASVRSRRLPSSSVAWCS